MLNARSTHVCMHAGMQAGLPAAGLGAHLAGSSQMLKRQPSGLMALPPLAPRLTPPLEQPAVSAGQCRANTLTQWYL